MSKILIADDEHGICQAFARLLELEGHEALVASNGKQAIAMVREAAPDVVFLDVQMPGTNGLEALEQIRADRPDLPVIVMTAYGTVQTAMEAMRLGAFDYLGKPLELTRVRQLIERALDSAAAQRAPDAVPEAIGKPALIGQSAAMQEIFKLMGLLTGNELTVLITGESGVGKELVARGIHDNSPRRHAPFVAVNCAAIPEQLLESELFGHERGAFTGAIERRLGRIEAAAGGTLFLDEIGDLSLLLQSKLLRLLQERTFERVGSVASLPVQARIIAATNRVLEDDVESGQFREDLYHRLNLVRLEIPPLRRRREDIPALASHFLQAANRELGKQLRDLDAEVAERLRRYDWPGNVRELENLVRRSALKARGGALTLHDLDLPDAPSTPPILSGTSANALADAARGTLANYGTGGAPESASLFRSIVDLVEQTLVAEALRMTEGNQVAAARLLGINRTTLRKKMRITDAD
jgi:nitrogen regulation protein NR(I)